MAAEISSPPYALEVTPETSLQFVLGSESESIPRCTMTLTHPGKTNEPLAFKVKTTQPRRYLVRPNQGVITSGSSETIALILVEKDKESLLRSYESLGQSALDHSKDKFLVQSCVVTSQFASQFAVKNSDGTSSKSAKQLTDALTTMWNAAVNNPETPVHNKKLHVKHIVQDGGRGLSTNRGFTSARGFSSMQLQQETNISSKMTSTSPPFPSTLKNAEKTPMESMTQEQMVAEVANLRRKYDELVSFSVNLTAERDVLNNTLEQTKRDLSREMTARSVLENYGGKEKLNSNRGKGFSLSLIQAIVLVLLSYLAGLKTGEHVINKVADVPVISSVVDKPKTEL